MLFKPTAFNQACAISSRAGSLWLGTLAEDVHPGTQHFHTIFPKN